MYHNGDDSNSPQEAIFLNNRDEPSSFHPYNYMVVSTRPYFHYHNKSNIHHLQSSRFYQDLKMKK